MGRHAIQWHFVVRAYQLDAVTGGAIITIPPEVIAAARAMRAELNRYCVVRDIIRCFDVYDYMDAKVVFPSTSHAVCQEWIDCQAFQAGLRALLPVSEALRETIEDRASEIGAVGWNSVTDEPYQCDWQSVFTAAIKYLTGGAEK